MKNEFFETIKVVDGEHLNVSYHQQRYEKTLNSLGKTNYEELESFFDSQSKGLYRCKIIYNQDKILSVKYFEYKKLKINSLKIIYDDKINYSLKSTNRNDLDAMYEKREICDDILVVKNGYITDTTIANIALHKDGIWYSPKKVLLAGTTRQRYLDSSKIILKDISVDELDSFSSVALLNAMIDFDIIPLNKGDFFVK